MVLWLSNSLTSPLLKHFSPYDQVYNPRLKKDEMNSLGICLVFNDKKENTGRETAILSNMLKSKKGIEKRYSLVVLLPEEINPFIALILLKFLYYL